MKKTFIVFISLLVLVACDKAKEIIDEVLPGLTEEQVVEGLKSALVVGTDTATYSLHQENGYYNDPLVKILLPDDTKALIENIELIPGGASLLNDLIVRMNRAAEDAATEATPIFVNAISSMTISDGVTILKGADDAATQYLKSKTYESLVATFQPKIAASLDKPLIGGVSASETWEQLRSLNNSIANTLVGQLAGLTTINYSLDEHVTRKGLDGLFVYVAQEEKAIRHDPLARVTEILKKVFGAID